MMLTLSPSPRWRKLEGSDPAAYEMLMKCQALQRRLILAMEASAAKEAQIGEQEALYVELKAVLARQPGPEAATRVSELQASSCLLVALAGGLFSCGCSDVRRHAAAGTHGTGACTVELHFLLPFIEPSQVP
jgi:hypothetical protein